MFNKTTINMKILLRFICVIILLSFIKKNNVPILEKLPVILKIENNINKKVAFIFFITHKIVN